MEKQPAAILNFARIVRTFNYLPRLSFNKALYVICNKCRYVNKKEYHFCTNCGYPVNKNNMLAYQLRVKRRKEILKESERKIQASRSLLYLVSIFFISGIGFLFSDMYNRFLLFFIFFLCSALFFLLARWTLSKPFTALLTAFIIILSFSTISLFQEFASTFTTVQGVYNILISVILIYFLLKGVQSAYKADLIKEEMEII